MPKDESWFEDIAQQVVEGEPVDWPGLQAGLDPLEKARLRRLEFLAKIGEVARLAKSDHETSTHTLDLPPPLTVPPPPEQWGHLTLQDKIGAGASGAVYRARDTRLDIEVAVKLIPDPDQERSFDEAQKLARVRHANVLVVHGVEHRDGWLGMWTELIDGSSLEDFLTTAGRLSASEASSIGLGLARALAAVHGAGLVHGDVKCANAMREVGGRIVLMDFGLASEGHDLDDRTRIRGTPLYMAPELFKGQAPTVASDLYAMGVLLYRLATGAFPIEANSINEISRIHQSTKELPSLYDTRPDLPEEFASSVFRCLEKAPERRFPSAGALARALAPLSGSSSAESGPREDSSDPRSSRRSRWALGAAVLSLALVLVFLILRFGNFRTQPTSDEPGAVNNRVIVLGFDNLVDPTDSSRLSAVIPSLLITDLSQSEYTQVVSTQRIHDVLRQMGESDSDRVKPSAAVEVARRCGARNMITGTIVQTEPTTVVTTQLVDVGTGDVLFSERIQGQTHDTVFDLVDRITIVCRQRLELPLAATEEFDPDVANTTTHSAEAYRHYIEAIDAIESFEQDKARTRLRQAVQADSGFALAWRELANFTTNPDEAEEYAKRAIETAEIRGSWQVRLLSRARYLSITGDRAGSTELLEQVLDREPDNFDALLELSFAATAIGDERQAIEIREKMLELYPHDRVTLNNLAYSYANVGRYDEAFAALDRYRDLAPDEPNPWDSRGEFLSWIGQPEEAIAAFDQALELRPNWWAPQRNAGSIEAILGRDEAAQTRFRALANGETESDRGTGRFALAILPSHRGKFKESIERLDDAARTARYEGESGRTATVRTLQGLLLAQIGEVDEAVKRTREAVAVGRSEGSFWGQATLIEILARDGRLEEARNELAIWEEQVTPSEMAESGLYAGCQFLIAAAEGDLEKAMFWAEQAYEEEPDTWSRMELGRLYLNVGQLDAGIELLEEADHHYTWDRFVCSNMSVFLPYYLGRAYETRGNKEQARAAYSRFLSGTKDADVDLNEVADARQRLLRLPS